MLLRPPTSTRTDPLFPYPTPFPSIVDPPRVPVVDVADSDDPEADIRALIGMLEHETRVIVLGTVNDVGFRSEEHTSELPSLMRISYAVFCLKKNNKQEPKKQRHYTINMTHSQRAEI